MEAFKLPNLNTEFGHRILISNSRHKSTSANKHVLELVLSVNTNGTLPLRLFFGMLEFLRYSGPEISADISSFNLVLSSSFKGFECILFYQLFEQNLALQKETFWGAPYVFTFFERNHVFLPYDE